MPQAILAVLSRRICSKARVKLRPHMCPHSICPAEYLTSSRAYTIIIYMYSYITGTLAGAEEGKVIVDNNGIGYELNVSSFTLARVGAVGARVKLFTHLGVTDDAMRLYGFAAEEERAMFLKLITVSGIGPKVALQILSGMDVRTLALAIVNSDTKALSRIKGIGKKTAERVIVELRERVEEDVSGSGEVLGVTQSSPIGQEAAAVLVSLGLSRTDAVKAVNAVIAGGKAKTLEEVITLALRSVDK